MGAIAGFVDDRAALVECSGRLEEMFAVVPHRCKGGKAIYMVRGCALGRTQSEEAPAVKPLALGSFEEGPVIAALCGRFSNAEALSSRLDKSGSRLSGESDEQLALAAYLRWGEPCIGYFEGGFSLAVWDGRSRKLLLARDKLGKCPLYYHVSGSRIVFASEISMLLAFGVDAVLDEEGVMQVVSFLPARRPGSGVFSGMSELRGGHAFLFSGRGAAVRRYFSVSSGAFRDSPDEAAHRIRDMLTRSVQREMSLGGEFTCLLSGGLDSSIVSALASQAVHGTDSSLSTTSLEYHENEKYFQPDAFMPGSDAAYSEQMSRFLASSHQRVVLDTPELLAFLPEAMSARSLPGMADIDSSLLLLFRRIPQRVVLSGECADELFGGYPWLASPLALDDGVFPWSASLAQRVSLVCERFRSLPFASYSAGCFRQTLDETPAAEDDSPEARRVRRLFYANLQWFGAGLLERKERIAAWCGVEARLPYFNEEIAAYAWDIPLELKRLGGMEKGILREAFRDLLPPCILHRKKSPFPRTWHPSYVCAVAARLREITSQQDAPLFQLFDREAVIRLLALPDQPVRWYGQLMSTPQWMGHLVQMDAWLKEFKVKLAL